MERDDREGVRGRSGGYVFERLFVHFSDWKKFLGPTAQRVLRTLWSEGVGF